MFDCIVISRGWLGIFIIFAFSLFSGCKPSVLICSSTFSIVLFFFYFTLPPSAGVKVV